MRSVGCAYAAFLAIAVTSSQGFAAADCLTGGLVFDGVKGCSYEALLAVYTTDFSDPLFTCSDTTAEADLWLKLNATTRDQAQAYVKNNICAPMYSARSYVPFTDISYRGPDSYQFVKRYFDGLTEWNEQVETLFGSNGIGQVSQNLKADSISVTRFFAGDGSSKQVEFPTQISNFQSCQSNSVMCCWVTDRQSGDANGNCASPYDSQCVDKDPGDNTDLCYVDHNSSNTVDGATSNGEELFPFDDDNNSGNAEGPIHCHGFAWSNDPLDFTARYNGNKAFFVAPYDHMNQRGYVRAVPGASMCACTEKMPVVSRADCSEVTETNVVRFYFSPSGGWSAEIVTSDLTFAACQGYRGNNNNLFAYMQRLNIEKKITSDQLALANKNLVGDNNCPFATAYYMQQKGYQVGFNANLALSSNFTQIGGAEGFQMDRPTADATFNTLYNSSSSGIVLRVCEDCAERQRQIFVRYNVGFRASNSFFRWIKSNKPADYAGTIGVYGQKWAMYSTYADALARTNPWNCTYNNGTVFPGDCDPVLGTVTNQFKQLESGWTYSGKRNVGFYIDAPNIFVAPPQRTFAGLSNFNCLDIGDVGVTGKGSCDVSTNGKLFIRGSGSSITSSSDTMHFFSHELLDGNITLTVRIPYYESIMNGNAQACLMIRQANRTTSPYFALCQQGAGTYTQLYRTAENAVTSSSTPTSNVTYTWLKVQKYKIK
mmetsp:Transcript_7445/g.10812  ORF Transcript_7445/g.10812 Transcript_7445/m.10812 type:complete len:712 (+) Transcript_7445:136-2271(+)